MIILVKNDEEENRLELTAIMGVTFKLTTGKISVYLMCSMPTQMCFRLSFLKPENVMSIAILGELNSVNTLNS